MEQDNQTTTVQMAYFAACPAISTKTAQGAEHKAIEDGLTSTAGPYRFSLKPRFDAESDTVHDILVQQHTHYVVVHVSAHGKDGLIALEDVNREANWAKLDFWQSNLQAAAKYGHRVHLIVFSSCESEGLATNLVTAGVVTYAVGFSGKPKDSDTTKFTVRLYQNLQTGKSIGESVEIAKGAVTWATGMPRLCDPQQTAARVDVMLQPVPPLGKTNTVRMEGKPRGKRSRWVWVSLIVFSLLAVVGLGGSKLWIWYQKPTTMSPSPSAPVPDERKVAPKVVRENWQTNDLKIAEAGFRHTYFAARKFHLLHLLAERLDTEGHSHKTDNARADFNVFVIEHRPLDGDRRPSRLRITAKGGACVISGYATVRNPAMLVTPPVPLEWSDTRKVSEVNVPECWGGDAVVWVILVTGPTEWFSQFRRALTTAEARAVIENALEISVGTP